MTDNLYTRVEMLIGKSGLAKLANSTVLVLGLGGVGSFACESLARSGVKKLIIVDKDVVDVTNINRQILATKENIGSSKVDEMEKRINLISNAEVVKIESFVDENFEIPECDAILDCIDTITSKFYIQKQARKKRIFCISSMGMGNRFDPTKIQYTKLSKTSYDPLAKALRNLAKKEGFNYDFKVVSSSEAPKKQKTVVNEGKQTRKETYPISSMVFVPATAGLIMASKVMDYLITKEN